MDAAALDQLGPQAAKGADIGTGWLVALNRKVLQLGDAAEVQLEGAVLKGPDVDALVVAHHARTQHRERARLDHEVRVGCAVVAAAAEAHAVIAAQQQAGASHGHGIH